MTIDPPFADIFPEPMTAYIEELATAEELPVVAIGACLVRHEEAAPHLRRALAHAADGKVANEGEALQFFRALHILAGQRDSRSFPLLIRLLQAPEEEVEWLLGDAITETLPKIAASLFDGDADTLFEAIANPDIEPSARGALLAAAAFLTWEGRIDRSRTIALLERLAAAEPTPGDDLLWYDWSAAIAVLGLRQLEPLVSEAETREVLDDQLFDRDRFERLLEQAERSPDDVARFKDAGLGHIDDVVEALQLFPYADDDETGGSGDWPEDQPLAQPVTNPWRHVGRNDPCPCGSGKKAKRCCLAA
ncbi:DUF1186 domain-containing protein [Reyranella sp.]|uniref:DUF1186 domain-containing protein n=1 Tax=Reyranella sp. TaxID=1929291 RepID=UPI003BACC38E